MSMPTTSAGSAAVRGARVVVALVAPVEREAVAVEVVAERHRADRRLHRVAHRAAALAHAGDRGRHVVDREEDDVAARRPVAVAGIPNAERAAVGERELRPARLLVDLGRDHPEDVTVESRLGRRIADEDRRQVDPANGGTGTKRMLHAPSMRADT